jgi:hypothetical protein
LRAIFVFLVELLRVSSSFIFLFTNMRQQLLFAFFLCQIALTLGIEIQLKTSTKTEYLCVSEATIIRIPTPELVLVDVSSENGTLLAIQKPLEIYSKSRIFGGVAEYIDGWKFRLVYDDDTSISVLELYKENNRHFFGCSKQE